MAEAHDRASESFAPQSGIVAGLESGILNAALRHADLSPVPGHSRVDPLSDVLRMVKLTGALFFLVDASTPWGVAVPQADAFSSIILPGAHHVVSYHVILDGFGWVTMPDMAPAPFEAGDLLLFPHGDPYSMLSAPGQQPEFDTEHCVGFFRDMAAGHLPFVVREGGGGAQQTRFVCGYLGCDARPFNPLLSALPRFLCVKRAGAAGRELLDHLVELTLLEACNVKPGGESIRLRLSELMFTELLRQYLETLPAGQAGWLAGLGDTAVGRVLSMLHDRPEHAWTLAQLAERAGMSRAVLADRFRQRVGCPPMHYLTQWRMQIAARHLADGAAKVASVSQGIGYRSEAAFSRAFKRYTGLAPAEWRSLHMQ